MIYAVLWRLDGREHGKPVRVDDAGLVWSDGFWFTPHDGRWLEIQPARLFGLEGDQRPCGVLPDIDDLPPPVIHIEDEIHVWQYTCRNGWQVYRPCPALMAETCMVVIR